ncbi:MAG: 30S ribosomal protein S5 [Candidatus Buchananbacteria bacterium RIFCSPHIGHO2_01_FULL_39_8]|uniref:Small ribosomal subunit protein uS5 n=1 Tax=Candidatus Buchananbacteria bacterium RIFCSPHIGHO2_01_FULL_39_8 TaxID=1797533 RepID=A0A1G1Y137_9BACT|nr:MAG: 30S ribosomal protein S5 [Candidatus Buchananbacteria bacterium RIFCSPHIGHO2_01_FULL_39_8]
MAKENQLKTNKRETGKSVKTQTDEFEQVIIDIARVTRVMAGGKRMRFRACVIVGNKHGKVGYAVAKGADVTLAVNKASTKARKNLINASVVNDTIPHRMDCKFGAAKIMLKPAPKGTGVIAGGAVRSVLELAGVSNVVAKILGSKNKINNVKATFEALKKLKRVEPKKPVEIKKEDSKEKIDSK